MYNIDLIVLKTYAANFMRIIPASRKGIVVWLLSFDNLWIQINTTFRNSNVISMFRHFLDQIK